MKRSILLLVAACLVGCASHNQPTTSQASARPVNQYCPINPTDKVDPTVTTVYKGQVIGFCCEDCIAEFKKNPDKYVATMK